MTHIWIIFSFFASAGKTENTKRRNRLIGKSQTKKYLVFWIDVQGTVVPYSPGIWICSDLLPHFLQQKICLDNSSSSRLPWLLFTVSYYQSYKTSLTIICNPVLSVNYNFSSSRLLWLLLAVPYYQCYNSSSSRLPWLLFAVPNYQSYNTSSSSRLPWLLFTVPYCKCYNFSSSRLPWLLFAVPHYQSYNNSSSSRLPWLP